MGSGIIFGLVDNAVLILGAGFGLELDEYLVPKRWRSKAAGAIVGAGIGNACSDFLGGVIAGQFKFGVGTFIGCTLALIAVPVVLRRTVTTV